MRILLHKSNFVESLSVPAVTWPVWSGWRPSASVETGSRPVSMASDLPVESASLLMAVRLCWSIEKVHHGVMDTVFHQDDSRIRTGQAVPNMVILKRIA